jgi:hypothetical protein
VKEMKMNKNIYLAALVAVILLAGWYFYTGQNAESGGLEYASWPTSDYTTNLIPTGSTTNYGAVNEIDNTKYVTGSDSSSSDSYGFDFSAIPSNSYIVNVVFYAVAKVDSGDVTLKAYITSTETTGGPLIILSSSLNSAFTEYHNSWDNGGYICPWTNEPWTYDNLLKLQAGPALTSLDSGESASVSQFWVEVEYTSDTPPPPPEDEWTLVINHNPTYGSYSVSPDQTTYDDGTEVTITATPNSGYTFSQWFDVQSGDDYTTNPLVVTLTEDRYFNLEFSATSGDTDEDGILDVNDNCPNNANADQADRDGDGLGDVCDPYPDDPDNPDNNPEPIPNQVPGFELLTLVAALGVSFILLKRRR